MKKIFFVNRLDRAAQGRDYCAARRAGPAELERVLCMHPSVALAAVGRIADEAKGELAKAYVIVTPGAEVSAEALIAHCRAHLSAYKVPRAIQFVDAVPMTASGKIMRRNLRDIDDGAIA
jgi:long-chain acyl-CoA synthetase